MTRTGRAALVVGLAAVAVSAATTRGTIAAPQAAPERARSVERGAYLVRIMGCNDCHTPHRPGPLRAGAGHVARAQRASGGPRRCRRRRDLPGGPWGWAGAGTMTAFAGPWGVSFTANLTPDPETGLGKWTEEMFLATIRSGRHEGKGRPLLPPMPLPIVRALTDSDVRDLFAYLQSLPPVRNRVPAPIDPPEQTR